MAYQVTSDVVLVTNWTTEGYKTASLNEEVTAVVRWDFTVRPLRCFSFPRLEQRRAMLSQPAVCWRCSKPATSC